jgi:pantoate--beta-alanine ligase
MQIQRAMSVVGPGKGLTSRRNLHVIRTVNEMHEWRRHEYRQGGGRTVGFVPTMGALHEGHMTLMKHSKRENGLTVASIFVNPTQFSQGEDLDKYPRQVEADMNLLKKNGVDVLFLPSSEEMYSPNKLHHVEPAAFSKIFEGQARPEFFRGVSTIVTKLFNIVRPDFSYFGQKDISQCILVRKLVEDLNIPTKIRVVSTVRDSDGLALSSRNAYLTAEERPFADILYRSLSVGKKMIESGNGSEISSKDVEAAIRKQLQSESRVSNIEYVSIASHLDMKELESVSSKNGCVISSAVRLGTVRLIDNLLVGKAYYDIVC